MFLHYKQFKLVKSWHGNIKHLPIIEFHVSISRSIPSSFPRMLPTELDTVMYNGFIHASNTKGATCETFMC